MPNDPHGPISVLPTSLVQDLLKLCESLNRGSTYISEDIRKVGDSSDLRRRTARNIANALVAIKQVALGQGLNWPYIEKYVNGTLNPSSLMPWDKDAVLESEPEPIPHQPTHRMTLRTKPFVSTSQGKEIMMFRYTLRCVCGQEDHLDRRAEDYSVAVVDSWAQEKRRAHMLDLVAHALGLDVPPVDKLL